MAELLATNLVVVLLGMLAVWAVSLVRRDASIADLVWGAGFVTVAWLTFLRGEPGGSRPLILTSLTTLWGLRLSSHLLWRNWGQEEDRRYRAMREHHGRSFATVSLFNVFLLQGAILWFVAWPVQIAIGLREATPLGWLDHFGLALWGLGFLFESLGDWQLARFKADPANRGRVLDRGLWRYTRHPNYFGDFCVWWGLYLISAAGGAGWTVLSPLLMSVLLLRISGVTLLERDIADRRPEYREYRRRTRPFFPGPPRR